MPSAEACSPFTSGMSFQFIHMKHPQDARDDDTRQMVRSYVMRQHNTKQQKRRRQNSSADASQGTPTAQNFKTLARDPFTMSTNLALQASKSHPMGVEEDSVVHGPTQSSIGNAKERKAINKPTKKRGQRLRSPMHPPSHMQTRDSLNSMSLSKTSAFVSLAAASNLPLKEYMGELLQHCSTVMAIGMAPLNSKSSPMNEIWLPLAMSEPLIFNALLFRAASTLDAAKALEESAITIAHRLETIRLINERLGDSEKASNNVTMAAITTLAAEEIQNGNVPGIRSHLAGLERLVTLRGGIESPSLNGDLRDLLCWTDLCGAVLLNKKPRYAFASSGFSTMSMPILVPPNSPLYALGSGFRSCIGYSTTYTEVLAFVHDVRSLLIILELWRPTVIPGNQSYPLTSALLSVEARIYSVPEPLKGTHTPTHDEWVSECCRLSTLIYINLVFRNLSSASSTIIHLIKKFKLALVNTSTDSFWCSQAKLLLWNLFIAGTAASDLERRCWISRHLVEVCEHLQLYDWESVKAVLVTFLPPNMRDFHTARSLWSQIQQMMGCSAL